MLFSLMTRLSSSPVGTLMEKCKLTSLSVDSNFICLKGKITFKRDCEGNVSVDHMWKIVSFLFSISYFRRQNDADSSVALCDRSKKRTEANMSAHRKHHDGGLFRDEIMTSLSSESAANFKHFLTKCSI